ncbi:MAG: glycoside hydrolase family 172 protein [Elusimicrobiota bacterium]
MKFAKTSLLNLAKLSDGVKSCRISSYDHTGGNSDRWVIPAGKTLTIAEISGAGCIRHIWMTTSDTDNNLRKLALRMYWDEESSPSVQCPLGDFFGLGHAKAVYFQSLPIQSSYLGMNAWFAMPFEKKAVITVTNDGDKDTILYFYIDYHQWDKPKDGYGRFHANWQRRLLLQADAPSGPNASGVVQILNNTGKNNFIILDAKGKGQYVGCFVNIDTNTPGWWGEGDDMIFIDGEPWPPRLHGTGMEDYFCGAWNYNKLEQPYSTPYYGYHFKGNSDYTGKHSQYRFHIEDPVYFEKSIRVTVEHGHANDRVGDWSSTAFWYQTGRTEPLPEIGNATDRLPYGFGSLERWPGKDRKDLP